MSLKSPRWRKVLLAGGLLLVLVQGLARIPEVRGRLHPGVFWELKLRLAQKECLWVERGLHYISAILEELSGSRGPKFTPEAPVPFGDLLVLAQGWAHLPEILPRLLPKISPETKLRLAQKECIRVERSLKYIQATLEAVNHGLEHKVFQEATGSWPSAARLSQALDLTQALSQRCWGYQEELQGLLQKWQDLKVSQINKADFKSRKTVNR